jgi:hydroxypyruvate isomerase
MMSMPRRTALKTVTLAAAGAALAGRLRAEDAPPARRGRIRHSVCKWCYGKTSLEDLAAFCAAQGIASIELVGPGDWPVLKKHGLICAMTPSHGIEKGLNRREHHADCLGKIRAAIEATAAAGFPNVICFSGNRAGMADEEAWSNCAEALKQVTPLAEDKGVTICMELLNSKRSHKDYHCDHTAWGVELVKRVGSPRFKLLYDIFHMQIMEGDVIDTIREHIAHIGHIHTGGVPGRNEIDETQELYYPAIMKAIADLKFTGYVAQEFVPKRAPLTSLRQAIDLCDV